MELKYIAIGLMALAMTGAALGVGKIFSAYLEGVSRNPGAEDKMKGLTFIGAAFAEFMAY